MYFSTAQSSGNVLIFTVLVVMFGQCRLRSIPNSRRTIRSANLSSNNTSTKFDSFRKLCKGNCTFGIDNGDKFKKPVINNGINDDEDKNEAPMSLIIASAVVAGFVVVFVCLLYCWHSHQLDARAHVMQLSQKANELSQMSAQAQPIRNCDNQVEIEIDAADQQLQNLLSSTISKESKEHQPSHLFENKEVVRQDRLQQSCHKIG